MELLKFKDERTSKKELKQKKGVIESIVKMSLVNRVSEVKKSIE